MGANTGNYSRDMFSEDKLYVGRRVQQGIPWVDADDNDIESSNYRQRRRIEEILGDGAVGDGFKCVGIGANNDFNVLGGDGTDDGAGRFFLSGHGCMLKSAVMFKNNGSTEGGRSIQPRITSITYNVGPNTTTIIDSAANWGINEHAGKILTPDITQPGSTYPVTSNTATVLTVAGDATAVAQVGDNYRIEMTTPVGVDRNDGVFLNVYLDEYDCNDDPNLIHNLTVQTCAQLRTKLIQTLYIQQGAENFTDYVDGDGKQHYVFQIARIHRYDSVDAIVDIDDLRPILSDGTGIYPTLFNNGNSLRVVPQSPLSDMVNALPGTWTLSDRSAIKRLNTATSSPVFPPVSLAGNVRYDLLSIDDSSVLQIKPGTEVAGPGNPFTNGPGPDNDKLALAFVRVTETSSVILTPDDITDVREFLNIGVGSNALANYGAALWLRPHPESPVANTLRIESGRYMSSAGTSFINKATAFSTAVFPPIVTPGNVRYDLVAMDDSGNPIITSGVEVAGPGNPFVNAPSPVSNRLSVAVVRVDETVTVNIDTADVTDVREYLNKGNGGNVSSINVQFQPPLTGAITLIPGANVILTQGVGTITVAATGGGSSPIALLPDTITDFYFDDTDPQSALNVELWMMQPAIRFNSDSARVTWFNFEKNTDLNNIFDIGFDLWYALTSPAAISAGVKLTLDYWVVVDGTIPNILVPTNTVTESITVSSVPGNTPKFQSLTSFKVLKTDFATVGTAQRIVCRFTRNITGAVLPDYVSGAFDLISLVPKLI